MKRSLILFSILAIVLCSCADSGREPEITLQTTSEEQNFTEPIPEATAATTEPTKPPHSDLCHPYYTLQQIQEYFEEVVLDVEYSDGVGDASLVQKWKEPILYRFFGTPTEEDQAVLESFFEQLNELEGFPGIFPAKEEAVENLRISFLEPNVFRDSFSSVVNGEDAFGATEFWYDIETNEIYSARIGYRTDLDQITRNSILMEEIVNTLGISDTLIREDSITYQYSNENLILSDVDWILLKLLYHPEIQCGMDREACKAVISKLYS